MLLIIIGLLYHWIANWFGCTMYKVLHVLLITTKQIVRKSYPYCIYSCILNSDVDFSRFYLSLFILFCYRFNFLKIFKQATKIRQSILGDNHPVTVGSLDFFTQVYAKAGADQYQGIRDRQTRRERDWDRQSRRERERERETETERQRDRQTDRQTSK